MGADTFFAICEGANISLQGATSGGTTWWWEDAAGNQATTPNSTVAGRRLENLIPTATTHYWFVAQSGTCIARQRFDIFVDCCDENSSSLSDTEISEEKTIVAFYSIIGVRLHTAPERGIYIVVFCDGSTEKRMK